MFKKGGDAIITLMNWEQVNSILASWNIKKYELAKEIVISKRALVDWQHEELRDDHQERVSQAVLDMVNRLRTQKLPF